MFARLDPVQFERCFKEWVETVNEVVEGQVVAIDGKTVRGSHDRVEGKSAIHMVSAWASANRLVLGQVKVADRSNEITAVPELLDMLDVSGCTVTVDAMGCQKEIARKITDSRADCILALKRNQPQSDDDAAETLDHLRNAGCEWETRQRVFSILSRMESDMLRSETSTPARQLNGVDNTASRSETP